MGDIGVDLEAVTEYVAASVARGALDPIAVRFLLSRYAATGRDDLSTAVGAALASALARDADADGPAERVEWLWLFTDALAWTDDARIGPAASAALAWLDRASGPSTIDACLAAAAALGDSHRIGARVDDLERIVGARYEPGDGVGADEFAVASALLTAYDITARLPYPMLAEELARTAQRRGRPADDVCAASAAARVLCRLQALHRDEAYVQAAVIAPDADYGGDAARLLSQHAPRALDRARDAAAFGLALAQWLGLH